MKQRLKAVFLFLIIIFLFNFIYPLYYNKGVTAINQRFNWNLPIIEREFSLGLDFRGGLEMVYQADLEGIDLRYQRQKMDSLRASIERRIDALGVVERSIKIEGDNRLIIELPGVVDVVEAERIIGKTAFLEFKELRPYQELDEINNKIKQVEEFIGKSIIEFTIEDFQKIQEIENWELIFQSPYQSTNLTGAHLTRALVQRDKAGLGYVIEINFNAEGAVLFAEITERNINRQVGIFLDAEEISAPRVNEKIVGGNAVIIGAPPGFSRNEANELTQLLNAGALPVSVELLESRVISPDHGEEAFQIMLLATIIAIFSIIGFMAIFYKLPGIIAILIIFAEVTLLLFLIKIIGVTLNMAGVAGMVLFIGIAIDANILFFSRMKEELRQGKGLITSIEDGFKQAVSSVRDGNLTTLIIACILFFFGTGFVQGFAVTLILGILISLSLFFFFAKDLLILLAKTRLGKNEKLWI